MAKKWFIILASLALVILANGLGVTRSFFVEPESCGGNVCQAWTSRQWTQTTQADFNAGVLQNVQVVSPGNVQLATLSNWYDPSWSCRAPITINNAGSGLTGYQVMVDVTYDADMQFDFDDIRFTNSDGLTLLSHWRESYLASTSATFWVKIPSIPSGAMTIYMYYGNAAANSASNGDATFEFFDDFEDGDISDWFQYRSGVVQIVNDGGNYVLLKTANNESNGGYSLFNNGALSNFEVVFMTRRINENGGTQNRYGIEDGSFNGYGPRMQDFNSLPSAFAIERRTGGTGSNLVSLNTSAYQWNTWMTVVFRRYGNNLEFELYNSSGILVESISTTNSSYNSFDRFVVHGGWEFYTDNIRVRQYASPEPTASVGSEENMYTSSWYNPGWLYRRPVTINHTQVADVADPVTSYANFPVLVYATGLSNILPNGVDIRFTASDGVTELPREIESYSSGTLYAWVNVDLTKDASDSTDDVIYMYYGNASASEPPADSAYGSQNVWDANYMGVWHLSEDPSGAPPQMQDSTSNHNDGTSQGSMTAGDQVPGQIDGSLDLDGSDDYIQTTSGESETASNITWEVWFRADVTTGSHHILWQGPASQNGWGEPGQAATHEMHLTIGRMSTADRLGFFYGYEFSSGDFAPAVEIDIAFSDTSGWNYAVGVLTNAGTSPSGALYLNGNPVGTDTGTETDRTYWDTDLRIGQCGAAQRRLDGLVTEVRVSNIARSAEWIMTCYNNQYSPSTFCIVGSEQPKPVIAYISPGTITSRTLDTGVPGASWDALFWDEIIPSNTDITFEVRAADTLNGGFPDASWLPVGGTSPITSGLPSGRYMQWRATLTTSDPSRTPILEEVRVYHY